MKSISGKNWEETKISQRIIDKVKIDNKFSTLQAKFVISKYFSQIEIFSINNEIEFSNPFLKNKDFLSGYKLLKNQIKNKSEILIIGDYDVDGCVSTSLMFNFLKKIKARCNYYIPDRFKDGYGADIYLLKKLISVFNPKLIIFLDCGSTSYDEIKYLKNLGIKSIIIDHHNIEKPFPLSDVFINPKKVIGYNNQDYFCSAFLTYFFLDFYINLNKVKISQKEELIYVLIATVADVMPIRKINRLLAINILKNFDINKNYILHSLFKLFKIKKKIELDDLAYLISPVLNSAGRLDNANVIVKLLTTNSKTEIQKILIKIFNLNKKRKLIESRYINNLNFNNISKQKGIIFIYQPNISEGLIGIIASRIKEQFNKPCIVFTNSGKIIKGSARSPIYFDVGKYINIALKKGILIKGGGHNLAAGVSLSKSKLKSFKNFLDSFYLNKDKAIINFFTSKLSLSAINKDFINNLKILGPFGNENTNPIFLFENVKFIKPLVLKNRFISCYIKSSNKIVKAISFNHLRSKTSLEIMNSKNYVNILAIVKENYWNNKSSIQLEIIDIINHTNNT